MSLSIHKLIIYFLDIYIYIYIYIYISLTRVMPDHPGLTWPIAILDFAYLKPDHSPEPLGSQVNSLGRAGFITMPKSTHSSHQD
jgi:hypothetical protein